MMKIEINGIIYEDACGNEYPVTLNGCKFASAEEFEFKATCKGFQDDDTLRVSIRNDIADITPGESFDNNDVESVSFENGILRFKGFGG